MTKLKITNSTEPATPETGRTTIYVDSTTKQLSTKDDAGTITTVGDDKKVKVSANDTTPSYLEDKFTSAGSTLTITTTGEGADEKVNLEAAAGVTGNDTEVQFNDGGDAGADANFTYAKLTKTLTTKGSTADSTAKSLIATNSVDAETFSVRNDGTVTVTGGSSGDLVVQNATADTISMSSTAGIAAISTNNYGFSFKPQGSQMMFLGAGFADIGGGAETNTTFVVTGHYNLTRDAFKVKNTDTSTMFKVKCDGATLIRGTTTDDTIKALTITDDADAELFSVRNDGQATMAGDLVLSGIPTHADEAAAVTAGLASDTVYKTSTGELRIKL